VGKGRLECGRPFLNQEGMKINLSHFFFFENPKFHTRFLI